MNGKHKEYVIKVDNNIVNLNHTEVSGRDPQIIQSFNNRQESKISELMAIHFKEKIGEFAIQNYGNITGDITGQQLLNDANSLKRMIGMAASSPIGLVLVGTELGVRTLNRFADIHKSRINAAAMQARLGITNGGSRY